MAIAAILMLLFKADYRRKAAEIRHIAAAAAMASAATLEDTRESIGDYCMSDVDITPLLQ